MRTPVEIVFENLEGGITIDEVVEQFPVTREQVKAVLQFARARAHGWHRLKHGELLDAAEAADFDGFVTTRRSLVQLRRPVLQQRQLAWRGVSVGLTWTFRRKTDLF